MGEGGRRGQISEAEVGEEGRGGGGVGGGVTRSPGGRTCPLLPCGNPNGPCKATPRQEVSPPSVIILGISPRLPSPSSPSPCSGVLKEWFHLWFFWAGLGALVLPDWSSWAGLHVLVFLGWSACTGFRCPVSIY